MSRKKFTKEFKLKLLKEHDEQGVSFWKLGKQWVILMLISARGNFGRLKKIMLETK